MSYLSGIPATTTPASANTSVPTSTEGDVPSYAQAGSAVPSTTDQNQNPPVTYANDDSTPSYAKMEPAVPVAPAPEPGEEPEMLNQAEERGENPHSIAAGCKKRALIIGINYTMSPVGQLKGCINDANRISGFIKEHFDFADIRVMTDDSPIDSPDHPTKKNLLNGMHWLVADAKPGDSFFFHFSGHGGQCEDPTHMEEDGLNETILPADYKQEGEIVDDELYNILAKPLPKGSRFTAIFDSCHSGTAMDLPYVLRVRDGQFANAHKPEDSGFKNRHDLDHDKLKSLPGAAKALSSHVKEEISHQAKKHIRRAIVEKKNETDAVVVMFSGCRDDQTSADTTMGNEATGAMSYSFIETLRAHQAEITYEDLLEGMRGVLHNGAKEFKQFPQLSYGRPMDVTEVFTM